MKRSLEEQDVVGQELSAEEHNLYDRQIRLWGLEAQKRLNKFKVCVAGLSGLGAEVAKNIILSGVSRVALLDHKNITKEDFRSQFMVSPDDEGKNRAEASLSYSQRLNPMVKVTAETGNILDKDDDFLKEFNLIVICDMIPVEKIFDLNDRCRKLGDSGVMLMVGHVFGGLGFFMSDLLEFRYVNEKVVHLKEGKKTKFEDLTESFPPLRDIRNVKFVDKRNAGALNRRSSRFAFQFHLLLEYYSSQNLGTGDNTSVTNALPTQDDLAKYLPDVAKRLGAPEERFQLDAFDELMRLEPGPVSAVLGGILGQEVVKAASQNAVPFKNVFLFDSDTCTGTAEFFN